MRRRDGLPDSSFSFTTEEDDVRSDALVAYLVMAAVFMIGFACGAIIF